MPAPYDHRALWTKAKVFINRSLGARDDGRFDEAALWASLALELLGKAALSKVSPLLIADPADDGKSLLIAAGLSQDHAGFKSIPAKAVFSRCARSFPPFNAQEAGRLAVDRNIELHSGALPFAEQNEQGWWQRFWAQAALLIHAQDETIETFAGSARVKVIEAELAQNAKNVHQRVESMIARAKQRFHLLESSSISKDVAAELAATAVGISTDHLAIETCPACDERGFLHGAFVSDSDIHYNDDDGTALEFLTVLTEIFSCDNCGLLLDGPEFAAAAGLPESFEVEQEVEPVWDDYGND